jgi:LacI family transcriptional regulator
MSAEKQPVTIWDIAHAAGVSVSTVSRVLSGSVQVTPERRAAVLAAVQQFHFRPNVVAQGLARGRSRALGVLSQLIASPFYAPILAGIADAVRDTGYQPIFASGSAPEEADQAVEMFLERRVDALIVVGGRAADDQLLVIAEKLPLVMIGRRLKGREDRCLRVQNLEGARAATQHLLKLGHTRIAHIAGIAWHPDAIERREGYAQTLREAGIDVDPRLVAQGDFEEPSGFDGVQALLARGANFSAIFAANDQMAYGALLALYRHGLRVPEDVSVVGFDDQRGASYTTPPLTTVRQPAFEMGRAAAQALLRSLRGEPLELPAFSTELIVRESTAPFQGAAGATTRPAGKRAARRPGVQVALRRTS